LNLHRPTRLEDRASARFGVLHLPPQQQHSVPVHLPPQQQHTVPVLTQPCQQPMSSEIREARVAQVGVDAPNVPLMGQPSMVQAAPSDDATLALLRAPPFSNEAAAAVTELYGAQRRRRGRRCRALGHTAQVFSQKRSACFRYCHLSFPHFCGRKKNLNCLSAQAGTSWKCRRFGRDPGKI
jgi:hypothetical protein